MLRALALAFGVFGDREGGYRPLVHRIHPKIIYFLHIHKCGGSTVCASAKAAGHIVSQHNCNVQQDQRCCGGDTLEDQQRFAHQTRFTFVANEKQMIDNFDKQHYYYITALRSPMARYVSHYLHVKRVSNLKLTFEAWMHGQPDNWMVRMLCGTQCRLVNKHQLTLAHYQHALSNLFKFDEVIFWGKGRQTFDRLPVIGHANAKPVKQTKPRYCCEKMTRWDNALYFAALAKFETSSYTVYTKPCGNKCTMY